MHVLDGLAHVAAGGDQGVVIRNPLVDSSARKEIMQQVAQSADLDVATVANVAFANIALDNKVNFFLEYKMSNTNLRSKMVSYSASVKSKYSLLHDSNPNGTYITFKNKS